MTSEFVSASASSEGTDIDDRNMAAWEAQRIAYLAKVAAQVGFNASEDAASLIVRFMSAYQERYSPDREHTILGPLVERAGVRYGEVRRHDFQLAHQIARTEGVRDILAQAPAAQPLPTAAAAKLAAVTAERDQLRAALAAMLTCPYIIDPATVPKGKQPCEAPDQVVGNMSVSGRYYANARQALEASMDCWRPAGLEQPGEWQDFRQRGNGRFFQARWCPNHELADGGAWEVKGETGYVHPDQAAEAWEFVGEY